MRLGGTKSSDKRGTAAMSQTAAVLAGAVPIPEDLKPLEEEVRKHQELAVAETLQRIRDIQTSTRDREGKIKRAKFKAAVLALRWEGLGPDESAKILGCTRAAVDTALMHLRKSASLDDEIKRIDAQIVPLAVDNLARGVIMGDKEYTLRVLDGRGVLRSFKSVEAQVTRRDLKLTVVTTLPPHHQDAIPTVKANGVYGIPKGNDGAMNESRQLGPAAAAGAKTLTAPAAAARVIAVPDSL